MKDVSRLAIGIILLGLAIFLTVDFEKTPSANAESLEDSATQEVQPEWQAAPETEISEARRIELATAVRPQFDNPSMIQAQPLPVKATVVGTLVKPNFDNTQLSGLQSVASAQPVLSIKGKLVPVQPKPSFAGTISVAQKMHTIRAGDSLPTIAREYFGDADRYLDIYLLNKDVLAHPTQLPVGVEIKIPAQ